MAAWYRTACATDGSFDSTAVEAHPRVRREGLNAAPHSTPRSRVSTQYFGGSYETVDETRRGCGAGRRCIGTIVYAQGASSEPPKARVALYRAAPGQQVACSAGSHNRTALHRPPAFRSGRSTPIPTATVGIIWRSTR